MKSSNPTLNSKVFTGLAPASESISIQGTVNKTVWLYLEILRLLSKLRDRR